MQYVPIQEVVRHIHWCDHWERKYSSRHKENTHHAGRCKNTFSLMSDRYPACRRIGDKGKGGRRKRSFLSPNFRSSCGNKPPKGGPPRHDQRQGSQRLFSCQGSTRVMGLTSKGPLNRPEQMASPPLPETDIYSYRMAANNSETLRSNFV
ncbi:hypothetical protein CDAR_501521 [Caerostris darwini]|uniref:Uncharacterized protein n=1 Tax=Caerostris darwini TaxID=1538125 RepID=A0AAV4PSM1_9ARAC|nr:hypothetical protein CDAR_501521 [Caerostris darwini]